MWLQKLPKDPVKRHLCCSECTACEAFDGSLLGGGGIAGIYRQWAPSSVMVLIFVLYSSWMKKWIVIFLFVFCVFVQCVLINLLNNRMFSGQFLPCTQSGDSWRSMQINNWAEDFIIKANDICLHFTSHITVCSYAATSSTCHTVHELAELQMWLLSEIEILKYSDWKKESQNVKWMNECNNKK